MFRNQRLQQQMGGQSVLYRDFPTVNASAAVSAAADHGNGAVHKLISESSVDGARVCPKKRSAASTGLSSSEPDTSSHAANLNSSADDQEVDASLKFQANCIFEPEREYGDAVSELKHCAKSGENLHVELHKFFSRLPNYETGRSLTDAEHKVALTKFFKRFGGPSHDEIKEVAFGYELFSDLSHGLGKNSDGRTDHMSAQELIRMMTTANRRLLDFGFEQKEIRVSSDVGGSY